MFGLGLPELLIIFLVLLLLFGASKLPQLGSGLGEGIRSFKKAFREIQEDDKPPGSGDQSSATRQPNPPPPERK
jgi:sec-independent protein translocase protein TatA